MLVPPAYPPLALIMVALVIVALVIVALVIIAQMCLNTCERSSSASWLAHDKELIRIVYKQESL
jgi:hypothetical protein